MATAVQITFDANDPPSLADFWAAALGYVIPPPPPGHDSWDDWATSMGIPPEEWDRARALEDPEGKGPRLFFQKVPEGKAAKNRLHLDLRIGGGGDVPLEERKRRIGAEADRIEALGASRVGPMEENGSYWIVMQDPEGNEFCVD